jgi:amino-acid N-acetyltransferase
MHVVVDNGPAKARRTPAGKRLGSAQPATALRAAVAADAPALHALVAAHLEEGRLLPRTLAELADHAHRFVVAIRGGQIVGCAELAPLSASVAEVRSLVVSREARQSGLGHQLVDELGRRARREGFARLCAFAHDPRFFVRLGFSIVPHTWVQEKIAHDCHSCPLFRNCGQYAIVLDLPEARISANTVRTAAGTGATHRG